jgi:phenylpropionate dioxygenase-like ring-hydroxylating dioxygenase large terminal subunit
MSISENSIKNDGSAYGRRLRADEADKELLQVGAGTPAGEYLRRFWHPVDTSSNVTTTPKKVRILGEDLILFRDGKGRPGLLEPHCAHRGTSLFYGKVDAEGIRCCYHGWQFDVEGHCLSQPCEPEDGRAKRNIRQPWYPLEERYGLIFAYLGPPAKKPILPRWKVLEDLAPGESLYTHGYTGFGVGADDTIKIVPMNWLRNWENIMDPFHVPMLHTRHRAVQYTPEAGALPQVTFEYTDNGMNYVAHRLAGDGRRVERVTSVLMPTLVLVPDQQLSVTGATTYVRWLTPVDDDSHVLFHVMRVPPDVDGQKLFESASRPMPMGTPKMWSEMTAQEHQHFPTDWEAMCSQGKTDDHVQEHLGTSDRGVFMLRKMLRSEIRAVQDGKDPKGVAFEESKAWLASHAGNYFRDADQLVKS